MVYSVFINETKRDACAALPDDVYLSFIPFHIGISHVIFIIILSFPVTASVFYLYSGQMFHKCTNDISNTGHLPPGMMKYSC
jgi:hypothetical protein